MCLTGRMTCDTCRSACTVFLEHAQQHTDVCLLTSNELAKTIGPSP